MKGNKIFQDEINKENEAEKLGRARSTGCSKIASDSNPDLKSDKLKIKTVLKSEKASVLNRLLDRKQKK